MVFSAVHAISENQLTVAYLALYKTVDGRSVICTLSWSPYKSSQRKSASKKYLEI